MNKIELVKIDSTGTGVTHIKVLIDEKDVGMLYLNADEVDLLLNTLKHGYLESDVEVSTNIYEDSDDEDELED